MSIDYRAFVLASIVSAWGSASIAAAQPAAGAAGPWQGAIQAPSGNLVSFEVDLIRNGDAFTGTVNMPEQRIAGLPLLEVSVDAAAVRFFARADQRFEGTLAADGESISGDFAMAGVTAPFMLKRAGDARILAAPRSPAIGKELEGEWRASATANGVPIRVVLMLANGSDGLSTARLVNVNEGGLQLPLTIEQNGAAIALASTVVPSSFAGTLSDDRTEITGSWTQGPSILPLTFRKER
jgi:hypothetical protein